jgi:hypothetical protein
VSRAEKVAGLSIDEQHELATADEATLRSVVRDTTRAKREVELAVADCGAR